MAEPNRAERRALARQEARRKKRQNHQPKVEAKCERCGKLLTPQLVEVPIPDDGGVVGYFDCPHCNTRYESYTISPDGLKVREQLAAIPKGTPKPAELLWLMRQHTHPGRGAI